MRSVPADAADLRDVVNTSRSVTIEAELRKYGDFATNLSVDFGAMIKGDAENKYVQKVHFSLNDIELEEIPLGSNLQISTKLMGQPNCNAAVRRTAEGRRLRLPGAENPARDSRI